MLKNTEQRYGSLSIGLHWLVDPAIDDGRLRIDGVQGYFPQGLGRS